MFFSLCCCHNRPSFCLIGTYVIQIVKTSTS
nr:MAG TPA: hypothetical protein [Caudoviricetes sp.]